MKKYILIISLFFIAQSMQSDPYTDYILKGSVQLNGNIYSSDFEQIGGYKNCCPRYESAFGLAPAIFVGGEIRNVFNLFGYDMNYSLLLGYNDLSANYSINQHIGNELGIDGYDRILVDHKLDITYSLLSSEHSLWFNPVKELPLGVKIGLNIGLPIAKEFHQREVLLEPSDATFPDGSREFNPAKAEIPNASSIFTALSLGARYRVYQFSDYELFAHANMNYGLGSIASDLDLNIHQLALGITVHFNIPKADPPRPLAPPVPEAPIPQPPPIARKPDMKLLTEFDYNKVNSGDTLRVTINKLEYVNFASLMPVLVFEKNSNSVIPIKVISKGTGNLYDANFRAYESLDFPNKYPEIISEHLKHYPVAKFRIIAESEDEDIAVLNSRLENISKRLKDAGIDGKLFTTEARIIKSSKDRKAEVTEEARKIFFDFANDGGLIEVKVSTDYLVDNFNKVMNITPIFFAEDTASFAGKTLFNGANETKLKIGTNQVVFSSGMFVGKDDDVNHFEVSAEVTDSEGNTANSKSTFYLTHDEKQVKRYINLNRDNKDNEIEEFILGYTHFDKADFYLVNSFAVDYIRSKSLEGRTLEIIPLTDNIGTKEYNDNLARKRAASAVQLLGKNLGKYDVIIPDGEVFSNESPYGRMMNRAVIIRIK
jgi:outer membrane protein OmpA-like peptidoglycan-associated protein